MVFMVAVIAAMVMRALRMWRPPLVVPDPAAKIQVLLSAPAGTPWQESVWSLLTRASNPRNVRVKVLLECRSEDDTTDDVDTQLRGYASVSHARAPANENDVCRRVRRLVRHFLSNTDSRVVVLGDHRIRLTVGWDECISHLKLPPPPAVLTATASSHAAGFPTLLHANGRLRRGSSRAFPNDAADDAAVVPSVCWCPELTVAYASALHAWPDTASCVEVRAPVSVIAHALIEPDAELEHSVLANDHGAFCNTPPARHTLVGLCSRNDWEATLKFGSARAARLARAFV